MQRKKPGQFGNRQAVEVKKIQGSENCCQDYDVILTRWQ